MNAPCPVCLLPHGAPPLPWRPAPPALRDEAQRLPQPRAIIMVSAHWDTAIATVGVADRLDTIHDFGVS